MGSSIVSQFVSFMCAQNWDDGIRWTSERVANLDESALQAEIHTLSDMQIQQLIFLFDLKVVESRVCEAGRIEAIARQLDTKKKVVSE